MQPNFSSIMPQALAVWCEEAGHDVRFLCYTGTEDVIKELPIDTDILFIAAYTQGAQLAYALTSPAELGRLGLAARRQIASENTWEAHIARYEELFGEVLAVRSSRFSA